MLCIAVTSLSIYLGVVEHVYRHQSQHRLVISEPTKYRSICNSPHPADVPATYVPMTWAVSFC
jgi:hypothetical protein